MASTIEIVVPVYNEEQALPSTILILTDFLNANVTKHWQIVIADNASTDNTRSVSEMLCGKYPGVNYKYIPRKGRGGALRRVWLDSTADIVSYMDVDLATNLDHFPQLIESLDSGYHIAIGSRLSKGSRVTRSVRREVISRTYNVMIKSMLFTGFPDAQCGFKALTRETADAIIPQIKDNNWFFDTELLIIAAKRGYRISSVPVKWDDDPNSSVKVARTIGESILGLLRLRFGGVPWVPPPGNKTQEDNPRQSPDRSEP